MKISVTDGYVVKRYGTQKALQVLKQAGFEAVDYGRTCSEYKHFEGLYTAPDVEFFAVFEEDRRIYEDAGMAIGQIHCPYNSPPDRVTPEEMERFVLGVKRSIRAAAVLGAPVAVVHPVIPVGWNENEENYANSFAVTDRLCTEYTELGEKLGVVVALENMPGGDTTVPYSCAQQFLKLLERLKSPCFKVCLDTGHANWALPAGELPDMARALAPHLCALHLHDNGGTWDNHFLPYGGTIDWDALCKALGEGGYDGTVNLETCSMHQMSDALFERYLAFQSGIADELRNKILSARADG